MAESTPVLETFTLPSEAELRFEVEDESELITVQLKSGLAEIFGTELVRDTVYTFTMGAKIAVFTWKGCVLQLNARKNSSYIAKETPMTIYLNCHCCLENMRKKAEATNSRGPITIIAGHTDSGKSTLCKILLNYAVRTDISQRRPIFVDVDIGQGYISIPGTIGAMVIERPASIEDGFDNLPPVVFNFGHISLQENSVLYDILITKLADVVHKRMKNNKKVNTSGVIINTFGWTKGEGSHHLNHIARAFEAYNILVLDQERLYNELKRDMPPFVNVALIPKSGGVVEKSRRARQELRDKRIQEYFYGTARSSINPYLFDLKFSEVKIVRIGVPSSLPASCLPLGVKPKDYSTKVVPVNPAPILLHHILALSHAKSAVDENIVNSNVFGFICVTNVDMEKQTLSVLSPQPKPLPSSLMILSDVQFIDGHSG